MGSLVFWGFVVLSSILLFPVAVLIWLVTVLFDRRLVLLHRFTCFWASLYTWLNPLWPVTITGRENIRPGTTYVLAANHLSLLDILVLFRLFKDFKWVSKAEIFKVPLIGWNMSMNRYIRLQRGQRDSVVQMMKQAQQTLESGSSIMMFPEGTRSKSGELQRFKTGAFELALATGVPVVPIVISGNPQRAAQTRIRAAGSPRDRCARAGAGRPDRHFRAVVRAGARADRRAGAVGPGR